MEFKEERIIKSGSKNYLTKFYEEATEISDAWIAAEEQRIATEEERFGQYIAAEKARIQKIKGEAKLLKESF